MAHHEAFKAVKELWQAIQVLEEDCSHRTIVKKAMSHKQRKYEVVGKNSSLVVLKRKTLQKFRKFICHVREETSLEICKNHLNTEKLFQQMKKIDEML